MKELYRKQKWYTILEHVKKPQGTDEPILTATDQIPLQKDEISIIEAKASKLLEKACHAYRQDCQHNSEKKSDYNWMDSIMKSGTLPDKMAAFIVRVQDSPIHNLHCLQQLLSMVKVQGRQQCLLTADTARDLFLEDLLPPGRKLIPFERRGAKLRTASDKELLIWCYEHRLKLQYANYLEALKKMSTDQIDKMRGKSIVILSQLLISHPEQEQTLLQLLVNKLGDPVKKIASKALFHLNEVLKKHPMMKLIVVQEVERLLFRNNIGKKAQYYGVCFLNIINLSHNETQLAVKLVSVYLAFFKACVKTGEIDSKMMGGLLNGVNRAFPIAKMAGMVFNESLDTLYKIVQLSHFSIGVQALALLFHVTDIENNTSHADRFYNSLYRKLMSEDLFTTSHSLQFVNLIFKAIKRDTCLSRVLGFTKRLLQVCSNAPPNVACALLYLISELSKVHKGILLLGKPAVKEVRKADPKTLVERMEEKDARKLRNVNVTHLMKTTNMRIEIESEEVKSEEDDDTEPDALIEKESSEPEVSIVEVEIKDEKCRVSHYDPTARNPKFCGAEFTFAYELVSLCRHVHPSVSLFAQTLLKRERITYTGNPLKDFTVARFLGRFVFRNPKVNKTHPQYQPDGLRNIPVNSSSYLDAKESDIPVEERFFYKYFKSQKKTRRKIKDEKDSDNESDAGSIGDDEFDNIMGNYFKTHAPDDLSEDDDIDFASEVIKKKDKKRKRIQEEESEDEDEEQEHDEDNESVDDADELIEMDSGDEPEYDGDDLDNDDDSLPHNIFDEDDDEDEDLIDYNFKVPASAKQKPKTKLRSQSTFAPAEQFSEILEANAEMAFSGSNDLINQDNADVKQLKWEVERDRWVKGYKKTQGKSFKKSGIKKRKFK